MRAFIGLFAALAIAACGGGKGGGGDTTPPAETKRKTTEALLAELHDAAGCETPEKRVWCVAADGWAKGTAADLPAGKHLYVGVAVGLLDEEPVGEMLESDVHLAAFGIAVSGGAAKGMIVPVEPQSAQEQEMIATAMGELAAALKGKKPKAQLPKELTAYLSALPDAAERDLVRGEQGYTIAGAPLPTEVRRVGDYWVAVETSPKEPYGILVAIFTDRFE